MRPDASAPRVGRASQSTRAQHFGRPASRLRSLQPWTAAPSASARGLAHCSLSSRSVLRDPRLHQLAYEASRQGFIRPKPNRTLAGCVAFELVRVRLHHRARVERTVVRGCAEPHQHSTVEPERGHLVADALLGFWSGSSDRFAQLLERGAAVGAQRGEVLVDGAGFVLGLGLGWHGVRSLDPLDARGNALRHGRPWLTRRRQFPTRRSGSSLEQAPDIAGRARVGAGHGGRARGLAHAAFRAVCNGSNAYDGLTCARIRTAARRPARSRSARRATERATRAARDSCTASRG
jgi:hypothetical protein